MKAICTICGCETFQSVNFKGRPKCPSCREKIAAQDKMKMISAAAKRNAKSNRFTQTIGACLSEA